MRKEFQMYLFSPTVFENSISTETKGNGKKAEIVHFTRPHSIT